MAVRAGHVPETRSSRYPSRPTPLPGTTRWSSTAHDQFKDPALYRDAPLVIDARNLLAPLSFSGAKRPRVVKA